MTTSRDVPISDLRAADEDTVLDAVDGAGLTDLLHGIAPAVLLEVFNAMLDKLVGEDE